jgi:hypothetical protein
MDDCMVWRGARNGCGYGAKRIGGKVRSTHRLAWEWANGTIPDGMCVLHRCDNPPCCNPSHLFLGTVADNNRDRKAKGRGYNRNKTHCPQGHEYSGGNLITHGRGSRGCRTCINEASRRYRGKHGSDNEEIRDRHKRRSS